MTRWLNLTLMHPDTLMPVTLISKIGKGELGGVGGADGKWVSNERFQCTHKCDPLDNSALGEVLHHWAFVSGVPGALERSTGTRPEKREIGLH